ncbi:unnamed protein product [Cylicostephanus goldi]|uniref:Uncharacterized protein n=1 Tax=Cylicostephanus goldi TaxID=71465 RepID=A0A3P7MFA9_CYLGO|nr:unnamed protein product [Cylicostephanus goldi]
MEKDVKPKLQWLVSLGFEPSDLGDYLTRNPFFLLQDLSDMQRLVNLFNKEFEFTPKEIKQIILSDPRVFMMDAKFVTANYNYVHKVMRLPNSVIVKHPFILRCSHSSIRNRHEFLKKLGRAIYEGAIADQNATDAQDENQVQPVSLDAFLDPSDAVFARRAANTYLVVYNNFLRNH